MMSRRVLSHFSTRCFGALSYHSRIRIQCFTYPGLLDPQRLGSSFATATQPAFSRNTAKRQSSSSARSKETGKAEALPNQLLFRYLNLEQYSDDEFANVFERIQQTPQPQATSTEDGKISLEMIQSFFRERITELEAEGGDDPEMLEKDSNDVEELRRVFVEQESLRLWASFDSNNLALSKDDFCKVLRDKASKVDIQRTWPITASMVLVGASVGVITPAMPFVVEQLQLTASEYGLVVSAFALSKLLANIPSAIAVERHGRHPYMVHSLGLIALGVGGIGLASSFEELYLCRLLTGVGVSLLSGAATLMVSDLSNPMNRASTMAPIMSGFAAGTALGPALGGMLVDSVGLNPTFYLVGFSYLGVAALNRVILQETQRRPLQFEWQRAPSTKSSPPREPKESVSGAVRKAVQQWIPLLRQPSVQSALLQNAFYWFSLAGAQMTLLPLILTDASGLNMTATEVGRVYMGMSLVQIVGNPIFAQLIDRIGKAPAIVCGCSLIALPMATLPLCKDVTSLAGVLGMWAVGSSMMSTAPLAHISDHTEESERAQAIALLRTSGDTGFLVGASAIGALADWSGSLEHAMQASAGLLLASTTWFGARQLLTKDFSPSTNSPAASSSIAPNNKEEYKKAP